MAFNLSKISAMAIDSQAYWGPAQMLFNSVGYNHYGTPTHSGQTRFQSLCSSYYFEREKKRQLWNEVTQVWRRGKRPGGACNLSDINQLTRESLSSHFPALHTRWYPRPLGHGQFPIPEVSPNTPDYSRMSGFLTVSSNGLVDRYRADTTSLYRGVFIGLI